MKKWIVLVLISACTLAMAGPQVFAAEKPQAVGIVEGNNTLCPVSGKPVSGKDFVIFRGKRYGLCCPDCKIVFSKDSGKYIEKMIKQEPAQTRKATVTPAYLIPKPAAKKSGQSNPQ